MRTEEVLAQIDDALDDWAVGPDAVRFNAPVEAKAVPALRTSYLGSLRVVLTIDTTGLVAALNRAAAPCTDVARVWLSKWTSTGRKRYDDHHPRPLSIDGAAYRRRVRARRRR